MPPAHHLQMPSGQGVGIAPWLYALRLLCDLAGAHEGWAQKQTDPSHEGFGVDCLQGREGKG